MESGLGESQLVVADKNPFGIKARQVEEYVQFNTAEFRSGRKVTKPARFRRFESYDKCSIVTLSC